MIFLRDGRLLILETMNWPFVQLVTALVITAILSYAWRCAQRIASWWTYLGQPPDSCTYHWSVHRSPWSLERSLGDSYPHGWQVPCANASMARNPWGRTPGPKWYRSMSCLVTRSALKCFVCARKCVCPEPLGVKILITSIFWDTQALLLLIMINHDSLRDWTNGALPVFNRQPSWSGWTCFNQWLMVNHGWTWGCSINDQTKTEHLLGIDSTSQNGVMTNDYSLANKPDCMENLPFAAGLQYPLKLAIFSPTRLVTTNG